MICIGNEYIETKTNVVYGVCDRGEPLATYDYVSPSTVHGGHGPERIVLKENEVYGLSHEGE